jgi:hypothetical protein
MVLPFSGTFGWKQFSVTGAAATTSTVGFVVILGFQLGGERFVIAVGDIGEGVAALIAAAACAWTASRSKGRFRRGWALIAASAASWCIGEVVWSLYEVVLGVATPFPSPADAGFLVAVPLAIAGMLFFWTAPRGTAQRWRRSAMNERGLPDRRIADHEVALECPGHAPGTRQRERTD